jgi:hypothetical protein
MRVSPAFCEVYPSPKVAQYSLNDIPWAAVMKYYLELEKRKQVSGRLLS